MSAKVKTDGTVQQLDRKADPDEQVTEAQVKDAKTLARLLMNALKDVAAIKRRWWPRFLDFEDHVFDGSGTTRHRFPHYFRGRVRWYVVDWKSMAGGQDYILEKHADTDENALVLVSSEAGKATIRVEEAG